MRAAWWMLIALAVLSIAYRYYGAFIAARVLVLSDERRTPAHEKDDGQNFHPTRRWVLFGHHFAAISGAGPLIGPVLAAQFGFLPGYIWILFGVVLGGSVHDFVVLVASTRRGGKSLAEIARDELGPTLGLVTAFAILAIVIVALAGLGNVVVGALAESAWGLFTVACSIPIALVMGLYIRRGGGSVSAVRQATIVGCIALLAALLGGKWIGDSSFADHLKLSRTALTLLIGGYGFVASVLPVWLLLCPRDYLSSYLKLGTIFVLVIGVVVVNPAIQMPNVTPFIHGGGPVIKGPLFPFVFITIACGAISGFHALVSSGTTPKMVDKESDCRPIAYGAMLLEGLVGITALIAACVMPPEDYIAINTDPKIAMVATAATHGEGLARSEAELTAASSVFTAHDRDLLKWHDGHMDTTAKLPASKLLALSNGTLAALGYSVDPKAPRATTLEDADFARLGLHVSELPSLSRTAGEVVAARTGGGVSLAVGMARVFSGLPGMSSLLAYWYHFAIMFEALFILTTIDTGTRIGRFLLQELLGRMTVAKSLDLGNTAKPLGAVVATSVIVGGWTYFILTGTIATLWPMFGMANQLLATAALAVATTLLLREGAKKVYALCTLLPLLFVGTTTVCAGEESVRTLYLPLLNDPATWTTGLIDATLTTCLMACLIAIVVGSATRWVKLYRAAPLVAAPAG